MEILWGLSLFIAIGIFLGALYDGRGFQKALRLAVGVLVMGFIGVLIVWLLGVVLRIAFTMVWIFVWVLIVLILLGFASKSMKRWL